MKRFLLFCATLGISEVFRKKGPTEDWKLLAGMTMVSFRVKRYYSAKEIQKALTKVFGKSFEKLHYAASPNDDDNDSGDSLRERYSTVAEMVKHLREDAPNSQDYFYVYTSVNPKILEKIDALHFYNIQDVDEGQAKQIELLLKLRALRVRLRNSSTKLGEYVGGLIEEDCHSCGNNSHGWQPSVICQYCEASLVTDQAAFETAVLGRPISLSEASSVTAACFSNDNKGLIEWLRENNFSTAPTVPPLFKEAS